MAWWLALALATHAAVGAAWSAIGLPAPGAILDALMFYGILLGVLAPQVRQHVGESWTELVPLRGIALRLVVPVALGSLGGLLLSYQTVRCCEALNVLAPRVLDVASGGVPPDGPTGHSSLLEMLVAGALIPAVFEEALFRGLVLHALAATTSKRRAIVLSALLFSLMHFGIERTPHTFLLGLLCGWMAVRTGSLLPGMLEHALHNGACAYLEWMDVEPGSGPGWLEVDEYRLLPAWVVGVAVVLVVVCVLVIGRMLARPGHTTGEPHQANEESYDLAA